MAWTMISARGKQIVENDRVGKLANKSQSIEVV
jgi:hypothetical protein